MRGLNWLIGLFVWDLVDHVLFSLGSVSSDQILIYKQPYVIYTCVYHTCSTFISVCEEHLTLSVARFMHDNIVCGCVVVCGFTESSTMLAAVGKLS